MRVTKFFTWNILNIKEALSLLKDGGGVVLKRRKCCRSRPNAAGCFFIAVGVGLFLAYAIPRYVLITLLGLGIIAAGVCIICKK